MTLRPESYAFIHIIKNVTVLYRTFIKSLEYFLRATLGSLAITNQNP